MRCVAPLKGYRSKTTPSGVVFKPQLGYSDQPVNVPCGQCITCRLERSRSWAIRIMHEAQLHEDNAFLTLTYDDEHLPPGGSLEKSDFQKFIRRLRKGIAPRRLRFYHCGEYGAERRRPHYHAILFGYAFPDRVPWTSRHGLPTWRSNQLESYWKHGLSEIGSVTFESAAYVARYIVKKVLGNEDAKAEAYTVVDDTTGELHRLTPEYTTMSRRPGIGKPWLDHYRDEVFPADSVVARGRLLRPPRYYTQQLAAYDALLAEEVQLARQAKRNLADETPDRLLAQETVAKRRLTLYQRSMEQ